jgi:hypothetical protein
MQKQVQSSADYRGAIRLDEEGIDAKKSLVIGCNQLDWIDVFQGQARDCATTAMKV